MSQTDITVDPFSMLCTALETVVFPDGWKITAHEIPTSRSKMYIIVTKDPHGRQYDRTMGWTPAYMEAAMISTLQEDIRTAVDDINAFIATHK